MSERRKAFVQHVIESPEDDSVRLIFADWLSENGEEDYGEFIRVQCALTHFDWRNCGGYYCDVHHDGTSMHVDCQGRQWQRREQELLDRHDRGPEAWSGPILARVVFDGPFATSPRYLFGRTWRRGFVAGITCRASDWLDHATAIRKEQTIEEVTFTELTNEDSTWLRGLYLKVMVSPEKALELLDSEKDVYEHMAEGIWPGVKFRLERPGLS